MIKMNYTLLEWQQIEKNKLNDFIVQASTIDTLEPDGWQEFPIGMSFQFPALLQKIPLSQLQIGNHTKTALCCISLHTDQRRRGHTVHNRRQFVSTLKKNEIDNINLPSEEYFLSLPTYKFVISPEGNGIDCHRHYEALMAGCIPIMEKNVKIEEKYKGLPILYTVNYSEITPEYLETVYEKMSKETYDFSKLFVSFYSQELQTKLKTCGNYWMTKLQLLPYYTLKICVMTALIDKHPTTTTTTDTENAVTLHEVSTFLPYKEMAIANHQQYCKKHGYDYVCLEKRVVEGHHPTWQKPDLLLQGLHQGYDYVFWNDGDSFFMNDNISLSKFIYYGKDMVATGDCNDITNAGHYLFRNSEWSRAFLNQWIAFRQPLEPDVLFSFHQVTTHLTSCNQYIYLSDQPCINLLLGGADASNQQTWFPVFNQINFYKGNPFASHDQSFSPVTEENLARCYSLLPYEIRSHVCIVKQSELNSTPEIYQKGDFVLHFVGEKNIEKIKSYVKN